MKDWINAKVETEFNESELNRLKGDMDDGTRNKTTIEGFKACVPVLKFNMH